MKNMVYLIGRLTSDPELKTSENDSKHTTITIAVSRDYKNTDGVYETDFIRCSLWDGISEHVCEYCHKGDLIGIKGRIQNRKYEENKETKYITEVIADKVSFLSSKKEDVEE